MLTLLLLLGCSDHIYGQLPSPGEPGRLVADLPTNTSIVWWAAHPSDPDRVLSILDAPGGHVFVEMNSEGEQIEWCQDPTRGLRGPSLVGGSPDRAYWDSTDSQLGFYTSGVTVRCGLDGSFDQLAHAVDFLPNTAAPGAFGHYWWELGAKGPVLLDYATGEHALVDELPSVPLTVQKQRYVTGLVAVTQDAEAGTFSIWHLDQTGPPMREVATVSYGAHVPAVGGSFPGLDLNAVVWQTDAGHAVWSEDAPTPVALPVEVSQAVGNVGFNNDHVRAFNDGSGFFTRQAGVGYDYATEAVLTGSHVTASGHSYTPSGELTATLVERVDRSGSSTSLGPFDLSTEWDTFGTSTSGVDVFGFENGRCILHRYGDAWEFNGTPTPWDEGDGAWEVGQQVTLEGPCDGELRPLVHSQFVQVGAVNLGAGGVALKTDALTLIAQHGVKLNDSTDYTDAENYDIDGYGWMVGSNGQVRPIFGAATAWLIPLRGGKVWHVRTDGGVYIEDVSDAL